MDSCLTLTKELPEATSVMTKQKTFLGGGPGGGQQGRETQEKGSALWLEACCLEFYGNRVQFWVVSGQSSCMAHVWSDASLSQGGIPCRGLWEGGRLLPPLGPSQILLVSFQGSIVFLTGSSYCETTHTSSCYHAWQACFSQQYPNNSILL